MYNFVKGQHARLTQCKQNVKNTGLKDFPLMPLLQALPHTFVNRCVQFLDLH